MAQGKGNCRGCCPKACDEPGIRPQSSDDWPAHANPEQTGPARGGSILGYQQRTFEEPSEQGLRHLQVVRLPQHLDTGTLERRRLKQLGCSLHGSSIPWECAETDFGREV